MKEIRYFTLGDKCPVVDWMKGLDAKDRRLVAMYIDRLSFGNTGAAKSLKGGLWELHLHTSAGLRVYFAYEGDKLVILLCGGDKSSQKKDIEKARAYLQVWRDFL